MPIFEFSCLACSKESEILVRSAEWEGEAECPSCGSQQLEKKLSVFSAAVVGGAVVAEEVVSDVAEHGAWSM